MPMRIATNEKFACFVFTVYGLAQDMPDEVQLGPRLWAVRKLDLDVAEHWGAWMGSVTMNALRDANLVLYSTMRSKQPTIYDQENLDLVETLNYLLYGILLCGVPEYEQGFSLNGANVSGEINVRQVSDLKRYMPSAQMSSFRLSLNDLRRAAKLINRLRAVNTGGADWPRLRRGLKVLFDGTQLPNKDGERLHQFVRAVEALVKPEIARTRGQFAHRIAQTFTLANEETCETLRQIFDLRSYVEHMHPVLDVLHGDEAARIETANRRTRQIDVLARSGLLRVMESDALMEVFRSNEATDLFWRKTDTERLALWGQRLDIRTVE